LLEIKKLSKSFGGLRAIDMIDLAIEADETVGLIGPNGAGKTTLFNCVTGMFPPASGEILCRGRSLLGLRPDQVAARGVARTFQNIRLFREMTVLENVMVGGHLRARAGVVGAILRPRRVVEEEEELTDTALDLLQFVGLQEEADLWARQLSYGDQRRLEIARALASEPSLLLLDEPACGMNPQETNALMDLILRIRGRGITVLLIEHEMKLVMGVSDRLVVLDHGIKIAEGIPEVVRRDPTVIAAYLGRGSIGAQAG
jgi:branched-chain amino acid transport system ATP-binding protein